MATVKHERALGDRQLIHRQALQILAILPDDLGQATAILDRAKFLLGCWELGPEEVAKEAEVRVLRPVLAVAD